MSEAGAALYGGLGGGLIGGIFGICGVLLGLLAERHLRRRGDVRIELSGWGCRPDLMGVGSDSYWFDAKFFNDKDLDTALWDVRVEIYDGDAQQAVFPVDEGTESAKKTLDVLHLPSRVPVHKSLAVYVPNEHKNKVRTSDRRVLVGYFPGGQVLRQEIL